MSRFPFSNPVCLNANRHTAISQEGKEFCADAGIHQFKISDTYPSERAIGQMDDLVYKKSVKGDIGAFVFHHVASDCIFGHHIGGAHITEKRDLNPSVETCTIPQLRSQPGVDTEAGHKET